MKGGLSWRSVPLHREGCAVAANFGPLPTNLITYG